jgi:hypothetical protein
MFKKWIGVALLTGCLGQEPAQAQYLPNTVAPPSMPEPLPCNPQTQVPKPQLRADLTAQSLVPGPISPLAAPPAPPEDLSLPANIPGAFQSEECPIPDRVYLHLGTQGLKRQSLGHEVTAYTDAGTNSRADTGNIALIPNVQPAQDLNQISPQMAFGYKATLGYLMESVGCAVELTGFYIPKTDDSVVATNPGRLNTFFTNAPLGFAGNLGIGLQADRVVATQETTLGSAEFNVRTFSKIFAACEPIIGVRYFSLQERFGLMVDDDGLSLPDALGRGDPARVATYSTRVKSNIIVPQVGLEYQGSLFKGVALGVYGKAGAGLGLSDISTTLIRGDQVVGLNGFRNRKNFTQIYETGIVLDVYMLERARVRAGYTALWIVNIPEAVDQFSPNLSLPIGQQDNAGNILYHGPMLELQFLF